MQNNEKEISKMADMTSTLKARSGMPYSHHFIDTGSNIQIKVLFLISGMKQFFCERIELAQAFRDILFGHNFDQVIEIASGFSAYGLEWSTKNPGKLYIESDLIDVVKRKKKRIEQIREIEGLKDYHNHLIIPINALVDDIYGKTNSYIDSNKKTLIISEGLNQYLDDEQHNRVVQNVSDFFKLSKTKGAYLSQDASADNFLNLISSMKLIKLLFQKKLKQNFLFHFSEYKEIRNYFFEKGFDKVDTLQDLMKNRNYNILGRPNSLNFVYMAHKNKC